MSQHTRKITFRDLNIGGISDSDFQGVPNSVSKLIGLDIHGTPGLIQANYKLKKDSGTTIDDIIKKILPASDGNIYFFGATNGKVWRRSYTVSGYTLVHTASPATGNVGILDAEEHDGYIYYATEDKLGRKAFPGNADWSDANDDWQTFTNTDALYHPMQKKNLILFIGDSFYVAQVDSTGTFTANALDIPDGYRVKTLGEAGDDLLVGTIISTYVNNATIFRWNTYGESYSNTVPISEIGVNSFMNVNNSVMISAGRKGRLFLYNGEGFGEFKRIPGDFSGTKRIAINQHAHDVYNGITLIGVSDDTHGALAGVYSIGSYSKNYPVVMSYEYTLSPNVTTNIDIGAISAVGDKLFVSWKDRTVPAVPVYGVDVTDFVNRQTGSYIETRIINVERASLKDFMVSVYYKSLPANTDIIIKKSVNYGAYVTVASVLDSVRQRKYASVSISNAYNIQLKIELTCPQTGVATSPQIESIELTY